jgi:hypothetical protein
VAGSKGQKRSSSSSKASTSEGADKQQNLVTRLRREVAEAVLPMATHPSFMKQRTDVEAVDIQVGEGPTDLVVSVRSVQCSAPCCMVGYACMLNVDYVTCSCLSFFVCTGQGHQSSIFLSYGAFVLIGRARWDEVCSDHQTFWPFTCSLELDVLFSRRNAA